MNVLQNCESRFLQLAAGTTSTNQLSANAAALVERYWPELTVEQQDRLQSWLVAVRTGARRLMAPARMKERQRRAEVATGAIDAIAAIKRKAATARS